jgi:hypothetical protein
MTSIPLTESRPRRAFPRVRDIAHDFAYLVLGLPVGIAAFTVIVTGLAMAAGLAITLVGVPILLLTLILARGIAELERRRASFVLDERIQGRERRLEGGIWQRTKTIASDPSSWRDTAWSLLTLPLGVAGFTAAVTVWSAALGLLTSPLYMWALNDHDNDVPFFNDPGAGYAALRVLTGLALVPIAIWGSRALSVGFARLARAVLS